VDRLTLDELDGLTDEVEHLVDQTPGCDPWCSGPDWTIPAHRAFAPDAEPVLLRGDDALALLGRYRTETGVTVLAGLEPLWGFACPLLGPDPGAGTRQLAAELRRDPDWQALVLHGWAPRRALLEAVASELATLGRLRLAEGITRQVADLHDGLDAYWTRRSPRFRRNLRQARRRAAADGLEIVDATDDPGLVERLLHIESDSWKGRTGDGMASPTMAAFYRAQLDRLTPRGRTRALVARLDGTDVGFIVGGRRRDRYRGLQLSYADTARELSIGHLLQAAELERLVDEGVTTYDLGMDLDYKRRWADRDEPTVALVLHRLG
jgi:CelD/BcsL family acetyltransferase involved in cellulose biosynthesis